MNDLNSGPKRVLVMNPYGQLVLAKKSNLLNTAASPSNLFLRAAQELLSLDSISNLKGL